jgi:hypothetical protein
MREKGNPVRTAQKGRAVSPAPTWKAPRGVVSDTATTRPTSSLVGAKLCSHRGNNGICRQNPVLTPTRMTPKN